MQLTKTQETELLQLYGTYFDSYMKGDVETVAALLDDEYTQIGSAESEVFFNKKDAVQFLYNTIHQVAGNLEMRNRIVKVEQQGNVFLVHELSDLYVLTNDKWVFYSKFRASTFMHKRNGNWKIIHQHSSFPDTKTEEGQNIGIDKIAEENQLLREAVKRRTIELEHKNRDLEIEAALERVRARTMAMQQSSELSDTAAVLFQQIKKLGFDMWSCGFCIWSTNDFVQAWMSADSGGLLPPMMIPYKQEPTHRKIYESSLNGPLVYEEVWEGGPLEKHYEFMLTIPSVKEAINVLKNSGLSLPSKQCYYVGFFEQGYLLLITKEPKAEATDLTKRFARVFAQTYTRFLDLQKAEAQTREAQIENALEKVRSRTMAMQHSKELPEAANNLFLQMQALGISAWSAGYCIWDEDKKAATAFMSSEGVIQKSIKLPTSGDPSFINFYEAYKRGDTLYVEELGGEALVSHYRFMRTLPLVGEVLDGIINAGFQLPTFQIFHVAYFSHGYLLFITYEPVPFMWDVFKRFAKVFEQTYTRFLDLQKSEEQAREGQVELGLERVRARAMAMQKSEELKELIGTVFIELTKLDLVLTRCVIMIYDTESMASTWWMANSEAPTEPIGLYIKQHEYPPQLAYINAWKRRELKWHYVLEGEDKKAWDDFLFTETELSLLPDFVIEGMKEPGKVYLNASFNSFGNLTLATLERLSDEQFDLLLRFAKVFDLTYTRFSDLQKAEANATEAKIEASLERVRSKAMSMHSSQDLSDTIGVFYHELELFSITPRRCGVGLIDKETHITELSTTNTTEQGKSIEIVGRIKLKGHPVLEGIYDNWLLNKEYHPVLKGKEISEYYQLLKPQIAFPEYLHDAIHYGYFFYFPEGGVYAWTDKQLVEDELKIYRRFTSVLSLTYKRYKDLKIAEAHARQSELDLIQLKEEKKRTEEALNELKETQKQLIQSEKMASLGELTAGIAHEIQNPLNFVNNFSEVSNELIDEMIEEVAKGNFDEVKTIADDVKQNLNKINHHGKRADGIVKGMLQHSRASNAFKELTDINKLVDEYLRLAYHGLRAKDKKFNAALKTEFDESIGNVSIIPQDIGRVILNLMTNAFYVVGEKGQQLSDGYEPMVSVSTKKLSDKIEISVRDNGNGIPQKFLDKIFQPFFTTKPTGQGTGLGLSLAYDIVKAHGGEIKVLTKEGDGTEFIFQLPSVIQAI